MTPPSTRVTAALANAAERRSIFGQYAQTPIYHTPVTVEAVLDEKGCLAVELPFTEAKVLSVGPQREVKLFLEPGDQLHIDADLLDLPQSLRFSGQGAANNQFLAALRTRFSDYLRIDYKDLEVDTFRKTIDQRRVEMTRFLDEGCAQGGLAPAFVDYYRAEITYDWAKELVSYPRNYERQNGRENEALPEDYYDILDQVKLVDETAIGTTHYRTFLSRNFLRLWQEWHNHPDTKQMAAGERRDQFETYVPYNQAKRTLHGKVLYFFLAGEIVIDFQYGLFNIGEQRWAEFLQDNPYPEYTEVVEEVVREASKIKPGQPAPDFTLDDLQGQSVSLSDFRGQAVFLDFWASWCGPCIEAVPHLEELKQQTRDQKVVFLNISLDPADEWHQAVDEHGLTGVHVHAPGGRQSAVAQLYQVSGIPSYFLVGPDGRMDGHVGHVSDVEEVVSRIEKVASGQVPSSSPKSIRSEMHIRG
ncbi:MAG: TlpA family protein disulfide reductase [Gemmatimonadetes bacterium]|nr:TlpA family protein disulfide reductase [Gemmatimonadota bacterium]MYB71608.1 TlpA family protein disulfide reductase [Gemmatimonadota bacterium]